MQDAGDAALVQRSVHVVAPGARWWILSDCSAPLAPGGTLNVGFEATKRGRGQIRAPSCSINGSPCAMR